VDETGISTCRGKKKQRSISWAEARLFAIDAIVTNAKKSRNALPRTFELAIEREIICWQAQSKYAWNEQQGMKTHLTPEQYAFQLQELHAIIVKKTNLPLYDLRK
jgi:hypothetical protein